MIVAKDRGALPPVVMRAVDRLDFESLGVSVLAIDAFLHCFCGRDALLDFAMQ